MSIYPQKWHKPFVFSEDHAPIIEKILARYPKDRQQSAVMPLLDLAQRHCGGWLPQEAMEAVAKMLDMTPLQVWEVASFYTMFHLRPIGQHHIQVCRTATCHLRGAAALTKRCTEELGIEIGGCTSDQKFSLEEVECLGACVNAPLVQINDDYYEDLTPASLGTLLARLKNDKDIQAGSQTGRFSSAPHYYTPVPYKVKSGAKAPGASTASSEKAAVKKPVLKSLNKVAPSIRKKMKGPNNA